MKYLALILLISNSLNLFSQVQLVEKNDIELIGSFYKTDIDNTHYSAKLKFQKVDKKILYELTLNDNCSTKFYASSKDINLIYKTVLKDFENPTDAKTKFKLGSEVLSVSDGTYLARLTSVLYNSNRKSQSILFINIDNCKILIGENEWKKLFGK